MSAVWVIKERASLSHIITYYCCLSKNLLANLTCAATTIQPSTRELRDESRVHSKLVHSSIHLHSKPHD
ncbi:hypothetical protein GT037_005017 [Alternaria burnsii]|uniref:Uncharacterized protein n=1 Tax=Alternaria burnsii TaxID=1187904 RepID=A0A8H7B3P3_9PLEO|nr:uncharacterized protein GT037_005017 [Alternaria burnsii]KAF7676805.1 hypothetical protein GT037_005017 [Alternaria burnsii]